MAKSPDIKRDITLIDTIRRGIAPHTETDDGWVIVNDPTDPTPDADQLSPDFEAPWTHTDPDNPLSFYLDPTGRVHLRGKITGGQPGSVVFNLPDGYRPEFTEGPFVVGVDGGGYAHFQIDPDGDVTYLMVVVP